MPDSRALCSWSGGKDSCLALHLAQEQGLYVESLLTMFDPDDDRSRSHALPAALLQAQADALGRPLRVVRASWRDYEAMFVAALAQAHADGVRHAVFGDIDLLPHREWEEKVCAQSAIEAHLPLWDWPRPEVVEAVFARRFDAVCVCVNTRFLPQDFCGRVYDRAFVADLPPGVDACGENGEFHTFVRHAPLFRHRVDARVTGLRHYEAPSAFGGDTFWFADLALA